jgi:alkylhydroperoxidase family enzyme
MSHTMSRIAPLQLPYPTAIQQDFERIMGPGRPPLVLFRAIATQERAWKKFTAAGLLDKGPLPMREREIVIDRTCANNACEYEWGVHITAFAAHVKLTEAQVRATVLENANAACWSTSEQVLIATVDALHARATLTDDEFAALAAHYDEAQILEILLLCGFYRTVAYVANGLKLPLEETAARFPKP